MLKRFLYVCPQHSPPNSFFFFFNDTATTEIYTLSLHDALPICPDRFVFRLYDNIVSDIFSLWTRCAIDRKSTRLNSSHSQISYAVFCLKKKKKSHVFCKLFTWRRWSHH